MTTTSLIVALLMPLIGGVAIGLWYARRGMSRTPLPDDRSSVGLPQPAEDALHMKNDLARGRRMVEDHRGSHGGTGTDGGDGGPGD